MEAGTAYVLGVDGLPLGRVAAVLADDEIVATFSIAGSAVRLGALTDRVRDAVAEAERRLGRPPVEVRLVLVDDGGDGSEVADIGAWLAGHGIAFRALDLVGPDDPPPTGDPAGDEEARSRARAVEAARW